MNSGTLPLLYAGAMLVDAVAALFFGMLYDKKGVRALVLSTLISAPFAFFVFICRTVPLLLLGIALWGVGMGAQESILKAAVTGMVPKQSRATGYGIFECSFGISPQHDGHANRSIVIILRLYFAHNVQLDVFGKKDGHMRYT